jgi:hypothetical protein
MSSHKKAQDGLKSSNGCLYLVPKSVFQNVDKNLENNFLESIACLEVPASCHMFCVSCMAVYPPLDNRFRVGGVCAARGSQLITQVVTRLYSLRTVEVQKLLIFIFFQNNNGYFLVPNSLLVII